jgi:hypothetical protein
MFLKKKYKFSTGNKIIPRDMYDYRCYDILKSGRGFTMDELTHFQGLDYGSGLGRATGNGYESNVGIIA